MGVGSAEGGRGQRGYRQHRSSKQENPAQLCDRAGAIVIFSSFSYLDVTCICFSTSTCLAIAAISHWFLFGCDRTYSSRSGGNLTETGVLRKGWSDRGLYPCVSKCFFRFSDNTVALSCGFAFPLGCFTFCTFCTLAFVFILIFLCLSLHCDAPPDANWSTDIARASLASRRRLPSRPAMAFLFHRAQLQLRQEFLHTAQSRLASSAGSTTPLPGAVICVESDN